MAPTLEPFPTETEDFATDDRISFSKTADTHLLEAEDGTEWEWLARVSKWIPVVRNKSSFAPRIENCGSNPAGSGSLRTDCHLLGVAQILTHDAI